jgi:hypothetical protein
MINRRLFLLSSAAASIAGTALGAVTPPLTEVHRGWFLCNGARMPRRDFPEMFATWGLNRDGEFRMPDLKPMFLPDIRYIVKARPGVGNLPIGTIVMSGL